MTNDDKAKTTPDERPEVRNDGTDPVVVPHRRPRGGDAPQMGSRGRVGMVVGLVTAAAAICGLVLVGLQGGAVYAKPVDELMANRAKFEKMTQVRAEGALVHGSLTHPTPCEHLFTIETKGVTLPVHMANKCAVPDNFVDRQDIDVMVTVEGRLLADNFEATDVLTKCPTKYQMDDMQKAGQQAPHPPVQATF